MNLVALNGNIATDIELRQAGDTVVTNINLAVKDDFKRDTTHFIRVEAWAKTAELLNQYCSKGSKIGVTGSLKVDKFQDKEGNNREVTKINANRLEFLDSKGSNQSQGANPQGGKTSGSQTAANKTESNPFSNSDNSVDVSEDQLPF
ncbi:single-stranded DNA-binding protein [Salinicoccus albus]|uniref:single-stranded DNA-binding protein n=1 Tax=Salinicoccus albus TaxID=418756 RepID=UPI00037B99E4|nr:single-stranded DNA-binding protein [Salinicoccus albus]